MSGARRNKLVPQPIGGKRDPIAYLANFRKKTGLVPRRVPPVPQPASFGASKTVRMAKGIPSLRVFAERVDALYAPSRRTIRRIRRYDDMTNP